MGIARTYLYVPGDREAVLRKAPTRGADALIFDLEDAVAPASKPEARSIITAVLGDEPSLRRSEIWVRINAPSIDRGALSRADLVCCLTPKVTGVVVAKTDGPEDLAFVTGVLDELSAAGIGDGSHLKLAPIIESARGIQNVAAIASSPRVERLKAGEVDAIADLGLDPGPDEIELLAIRSAIVTASAAAGLLAPVGPVYRDRDDRDGLLASTQRLRRLGFVGRSVIHPSQIATVHEVFTPTPSELQRAQRIVERYEKESAAGNGAYLDEDGRMVDIAVVRSAWRTLALRHEA